MKAKEYRWVQVVTSAVAMTAIEDGYNIVNLIRTTNSEDKTEGLDDLIYRHRSQLGADAKVVWSNVTFMNAYGEMSNQTLPLM